MMMRYDLLFGVSCLHTYFAGDPPRCPSLALHPTEACRDALAHRGLLYRALPGGGAVLVGQDGSGEPVLFPDEEPLLLSFTLRTSDVNFTNYTDLPLGEKARPPSQSVYYFSNVVDAANVQDLFGERRLLLHPGDRVNGGDQVAVWPRYVDIPCSPGDGAQVRDRAGRVVWEHAAGQADVDRLHVDLRGHPPGRYTLDVDGAAPQPYVVLDELPGGVWGFVEILVGSGDAAPVVPGPYAAVSPEGKPLGPAFTVLLRCRRTTWRYLVARRPDSSWDSSRAQVVGRHNGDRPGTIVFNRMPASQPGFLTFESAPSNPIPLLEKPGALHSFELTDGTRTFRLPYAGVALIQPEPTGTGIRALSDIYVYL